MRHTSIRITLAISTAAVLVALVGCSDDSNEPQVTPTSLAVPATAPAISTTLRLVAEPPGGALSTSAEPGEVLYDATMIVRNDGPDPVRILSATPGAESGESMTVLKVQLVELSADTARLGLLREFPPPFAAHLRLQELPNVTIPADGSHRFALVLTLKATEPGVWHPGHTLVTFESNGGHHQLDVAQTLRVCVSGTGSTCS